MCTCRCEILELNFRQPGTQGERRARGTFSSLVTNGSKN
jgi:hypothetical protein